MVSPAVHAKQCKDAPVDVLFVAMGDDDLATAIELSLGQGSGKVGREDNKVISNQVSSVEILIAASRRTRESAASCHSR